MKNHIKRINRYRNQQTLLLENLISKDRSHLYQPSPSLMYKRYLSSIIHNQNKTNLLFAIIKSNTKKDNKAASLFCIDLETNKIINYEFHKGLNNVKNLKNFIVNNIVGKNEVISKLFLPKISESVNLNKFLDLNKIKNVEYYNYKTLTKYNNLLLSLRKNFLESSIEDINMLVSFVEKYNKINFENNFKVGNKIKLENNFKGVRHYSTLLPPVLNTETRFGWHVFCSNQDYTIITAKEFEKEFMKFIEYYKSNFNIQHLVLLPKLMLKEGVFRTISPIKFLDINNYDEILPLYKFILSNEDILSALSYEDDSFVSKFPRGKIVFNFKAIKDPSKFNNKALISPEKIVINKNVKDINKVLNYRGINLPLTMDLYEYKGINFDQSFKTANFQIKLLNNNKPYFINGLVNISDTSYEITFYLMSKDKVTKLFTIVDTLSARNYDLTSFKREYYEDGKLKLTNLYVSSKLKYSAKPLKVSYIKQIKPDKKINLEKICTLDIETRMDTKTNRLIPICMSFYINKKTHSFVFTANWVEEMKDAFKSIMKRQNRDLRFYIHNLSNFDNLFLLDVLSTLGSLDIKKRGQNILKIDFTFTNSNTKYKFHFFDSYLILPASLKDLSDHFNIPQKKILFPIFFPNTNFDMNYIGPVPNIEFFPKNTSIQDYTEYCNNYKNNDWNFKKELILYCEIDCIALHSVVCVFAEQIFKLTSIDITLLSTVPSIALKDFRANFLKKDTIINISDKNLHNEIKSAFYGGYCDVFKPYGTNIISFDVISQYPSVMFKYPMPTKSMTRIVGDPYLFVDNPFGFFYVNVTAPENLHIPILPKRIKSNGSVRTIYPTGTWSGLYFSEEIKNAEKYGYKFEIKEAILFDSDIIFDGFIGEKFNIKKSFKKSDPMYFIAKLLMNGLYGRFGMDSDIEQSVIVSADESETILSKYKVIDCIPLPSGNIFITYVDESLNVNFNTSVAISAAVTAYARIEMSKFLIKYPHNIYAIDTDGIKMDTYLDPEDLSDTELGKMKYEYTFDKAIFIAPKVYGGLITNPINNQVTELVKVKGLKSLVSFEGLKMILYKNNFQVFEHEKFYKELALSTIVVKKTSYKLKISSHKRVLVFDGWGKFINTLPHELKNGKLVTELTKTIYSITD